MAHRLERFALAGLLWTAFGTLAVAQTQPLPALPEPEPGGEETETTARTRPEPQPLLPTGPGSLATAQPVSRTRPRPWQYGLGVGAFYESNIGFGGLQSASAVSGFAFAPRGSVTRVFWSPKWQVRVNGDGQWRGYPQHADLNRYYANGSLNGSYRPTPATSWNTNLAFGYGHTDSTRILAEQGVQLPLAKTRNLNASLGVTHQLGPRSSLRASVSANRTTFDQPPPPAPQLYDGQSTRFTTGFDRRLGSRDTTGIEYSLERTRSGQSTPGSHYLTHFASLQWSHVLTPRSGLLLDGGASYTPEATLAGLQRRGSFFGGASFNRKVKRSTVLLFARREVTPAFGIGVSRLEDRFGLNVTTPLGQRWQMTASGTHVEPHAPGGATGTGLYGRSDDGALTVSRRLGRNIDLSAQGSYRRYGGAAGSAATDSYQVGAFVSLVNP